MQAATAEMQRLGLPVHITAPKNWDTLGALRSVLATTDMDALIVDGGGEYYSTLLPSLFLCGYSNLLCINKAFFRPVKRGTITYSPGDITHLRLKDSSVGAYACLSVIEHGVDLGLFLREAWRVLRPNSPLIVSTDYWPDPIDTGGKQAFGVPVQIFDRQMLQGFVTAATGAGFLFKEPLELGEQERVVRWDEYALDYTFVILTLWKP